LIPSSARAGSARASSRTGNENFKHSVEVTAETLYEAAVLGIKAMNVPREESGRR
jgi:hypothetical protein